MTKLLLLLLLAQFAVSSVYAQSFPQGESEEVVELVFEELAESNLIIREDTFIPNIMGYACPVPAINLERHTVWNRALNHRGFGDFGVRVFALRIKDPNMRFCSFPKAVEVFGEEFKVGAKFKLEIHIKREILKVTTHDGVIHKVLQETISSELAGKELISRARVLLGSF